MICASVAAHAKRLFRRAFFIPRRRVGALLAVVVVGLVLPLVAYGLLTTGPVGDRHWFWQNPLPQGNDLRATSWPTPDIGYAVGVTGTLLKSVDGGATWVAQDSHTGRDLTGISFVSASEGWAVGVSGTVLHTSDGGSNWTAQTAPTSPASANFRSVSFFDANVGVAVGDQGTATSTIDYTFNGGATWRRAGTTATVGVTSVWMSSATIGWAVGGNGTLLKTADAGATWTPVASGTTAGLSGIAFSADGRYGYFVGNVAGSSWTIYRTADFGATWTAVSGLGNTGAVNLTGVSVYGASDAVVIGTNGAIRRTRDGGATWLNQSQNNVGGVALRGVDLLDPDNARIVGDYGYVCYTATGGDMYADTDPWTSSTLYASSFVDASHGWAVGANGTIMRTADAGGTWFQQAAGIVNWRDVYFRDRTHGWVVGDSGKIMRTVDAGTTWQSVTSGTTQQLNGVWFVSANTGIAVGTNGTVVKTTDGGVTWQAKVSHTDVGLNGVWFADGSTGYAVGDAGHVEKTTDGGDTWSNSVSGGQDLLSVSGVDASLVWVAGNGGTVRHTVNGGTDGWPAQTSGVTGSQPVRVVRFVDENTGWLASTYGVVRTTSNGGGTWTAQTVGLPTVLTDASVGVWGLSAIDADTVFIVGDGGLTHRTTSGGTGTSWESLQYGTKSVLRALSAPDSLNGWIVGDAGTVMHTSDGGQVWSRQRTGTTNILYSVLMLDANRGWAVGGAGTARYTTNGGYTWTAQATTVTVALQSVASADGTAAIIAGSGAVKYTTTSGSAWTTATTPPTRPVTGMYMSNEATAWAVTTRVTGNNSVWRTDDGGNTWTAQPTTANANLWAVYFLDKHGLPDTGFAVGDSGVILKTTDGGATWVRQQTIPSTTLPIYAIRFTSADTGIAVGGSGLVLRTTDGGATWRPQSSGTARTLSAVGAFGAGKEWAAGSNGALLRMADLTPPVTTLSMAPASANGQNGWYVSQPTITLESAPSAVTSYNWTSPAGPWNPYTSPFLATMEDSQTLYYRSIDSAGSVESPKSALIKLDLTDPSAPPSVTASQVSTSSALIGWAAATDTPSGVDYYEVSVDGSFVASTTATSRMLTGLSEGHLLYSATVVAVDVAGRHSGTAGTFFDTNTTNLTPLTTQLTASPAAPDGANLWYRDTTPTITLASLPDGAPATTLFSWDSADGPYTPYVGMFDAIEGSHTLFYSTHDPDAIRFPEPTQTATFRVDTSVPATPSVTATATSYKSIVATWPAIADAPSGPVTYDVYLDTVLHDSGVTSTGVEIAGLRSSRAYAVTVKAVTVAGNRSGESIAAGVTTLLAPSPDAPSDVYAKSPSGEYAFVNWSPITVSDGAVSYHIWRSTNGTDYSEIATTTGGIDGFSYLDQGLTSSTRYWYAVSAIDARGEGATSSTDTAVWPSIAPTSGPPARPSGIASYSASGTVSVTWSASANPGIAGYYVLRAPASLSTTVTTFTVAPALANAYVDTTAVNGEPYYYSVVAFDAAGTLSYPSLEVMGRAQRPTSVTGPSPHPIGDRANACICHSTHSAVGDSKRTRVPGNPANVCDACHPPASSRGEFLDPLAQSRHALQTTATPGAQFTCLTCHVPVYNSEDGESANLMRTNSSTVCTEVTDVAPGNGFCYSCHGTESTLPKGDLTAFQLSGHNNIPAPATGADIVCDACHESHSSRNEHLNRYSGFMMCMQCHTSASSNPNEADIWSKLQYNQTPNTKHPLLPSDQASGARMMCQNCHNPHLSTVTYPLVDPHDPSPAGVWTTARTDEKDYCFRCHDGQQLPTSEETTSWAAPVLASGGATVTADIKAAYQTNIHGFGVGDEGRVERIETYLRADMDYTANMTLECRTCHDPHGTLNDFALVQNVKSASGDKTVNGVVVAPVPDGGGYDLRFFCSSCHVFQSATHDSMAGTSTASFPMDCTACHSHINPRTIAPDWVAGEANGDL